MNQTEKKNRVKILMVGGNPLSGSMQLSGSKNACLSIMPVSLITEEKITLTNVPKLLDTDTMGALLSSLGVSVNWENNKVEMLSGKGSNISTLAQNHIVKKMRAGILVMGALLARFGEAKVYLPGGCAIGSRPVDIHIEGLKSMGVIFEYGDDYIHARVKRDTMTGTHFSMPSASVGATVNLMISATLANGDTIIDNAAREPEITDLADCLRKMGALIEGDGSPQIYIKGVASLKGTSHNIIADRIELGSYMIAPAIIGGEIEIIGGKAYLVESLIEKLKDANVSVKETQLGIKVAGNIGDIRPLEISTKPFPGFPTDLQAQIMALLTLSSGVSIIEENIFENRFMHVPELRKLGAEIKLNGGRAVITGVNRLKGNQVLATDLRASFCLILAGLRAEGVTTVSDIHHLDRGYEMLEKKFTNCGANIWREN